MFDEMANALARGGRIEIRGFGSFGVKNAAPARDAIRAPATWSASKPNGSLFPHR